MIPTRPEPPALPGVIPPPPPWYRSAAVWLVRHIGRLRFELAPIGGAAAYATAVDIYAATDNAAEPVWAFGIAAGGCAAVAGFLIAKEEPEATGRANRSTAAYRLGSASAACAWGCWQLASDSALVPGLILGSVATAVISIPYWRSLGAKHEAAIQRAEHRLDRDTDERIAQTRAMEAAFKARAKLIPGQREAPPLETVADTATQPGQFPVVHWPGAPTGLSINDPIALSDRTSITLPGVHILVGGGTDMGKSGILHCICCNVLARKDARLFIIDFKPNAVEHNIYRLAGVRVASTPAEATRMLKDISDEAHRRGDRLGATVQPDGSISYATSWIPTPEDPQLVLVIDELAELTEKCPAAVAELRSHTRLLRALGETVIVGSQITSRQTTGGNTDARGQFGLRIGVRVFEKGQTNMIFGQGADGAGIRPDLLREPGEFLVHGRHHDGKTPDRAYLLTPQAIANHVARHIGGAISVPEHEPEAFAAPDATKVDAGRIDNATELITDYLREHGPSTVEEVHHGLGLPPEKLISVRTLMRRHGNTGRFVTVNGGRYKLPKTDGTVVRFRSRRNA